MCESIQTARRLWRCYVDWNVSNQKWMDSKDPWSTTTKLGKYSAPLMALLTLKRYKSKHGGFS